MGNGDRGLAHEPGDRESPTPTRTRPADRPLWIVWRQDDNGHQFEVARHTDRAAADAQAAEMASRGHKQMYWVARADP